MSAGPDTTASDSRPPTSTVATATSSVATATLPTKHVVHPPRFAPYPDCLGRDLRSQAKSMVYKCDPDTNEPVINHLRLQEIQEALFDVWGVCMDVQVEKFYPKNVLCGLPISTCPDDANNVTYANALVSECASNSGEGILWRTCDPHTPTDCRTLELSYQDARRFEQDDLIMYFNRKVKVGCELCRCDFESRRVDCSSGARSFKETRKEICLTRWSPFQCERESHIRTASIFKFIPEDDEPEADNRHIKICHNSDDDCETMQVVRQKATWLKELSPFLTTTLATTTAASDNIRRLVSDLAGLEVDVYPGLEKEDTKSFGSDKFPGLELDKFPGLELDKFPGLEMATTESSGTESTDGLHSKISSFTTGAVGLGVVGCVLTAAAAVGACVASRRRKMREANEALAAQRDGADNVLLEEVVHVNAST